MTMLPGTVKFVGITVARKGWFKRLWLAFLRAIGQARPETHEVEMRFVYRPGGFGESDR